MVSALTGDAIANASVKLIRWKQPFRGGWPPDGAISSQLGTVQGALTDDDGRFRFESGEAENDLLVTAEGYPPTRIRASGSFVEIRVPEAASLGGDISALMSHFDQRLAVQIEAAGFSYPAVFPDESGSFWIGSLPPGEAKVTIQKENTYVRQRSVTLRAGEETRVDFGEDTAPCLEGTVMFAGSPAQGVRVFIRNDLQSSSTETDGRGEYSISGLAPGRYQVLVTRGKRTAPDYSLSMFDVDIGTELLRRDVVLPSASLAGLVQAAEPGTLVRLFRWLSVDDPANALYQRGEAGWIQERSAKTAADGSFFCHLLPAGRYVVAVGNVRSAPIQLDEGAEVHGIDLVVGRGSPLTVVVAGETGGEVRTSLYLTGEERVPLEHLSAYEDGTWKSSRVPPGRYRLQVSRVHERSVLIDVETDGSPQTVSVSFPDRGWVRFRLLGTTPAGKTPILVLTLDEIVSRPFGGGQTREVVLAVDAETREVTTSIPSPGPHVVDVAVYRAESLLDFMRGRRMSQPIRTVRLSWEGPQTGEVLVEVPLD